VAFDFWRFMASPNQAARHRRRAGRGAVDRPRVPWWISICFIVGLLRAIVGTLTLLALSVSVDEPMPAWFNWLVLLHGVALVVALVFLLNGFGWARLALLVLTFAQWGFDQAMITKYFTLLDIAILIVAVLPASAAYIGRCADARHAPR